MRCVRFEWMTFNSDTEPFPFPLCCIMLAFYIMLINLFTRIDKIRSHSMSSASML